MNPSDRETRAIFLNFKEIRNLERNVNSLDGEKSYYVSLINLDQKIVKVHYKRLKDKVSKIRSHLSKDQLYELKSQDDEGDLPTRPKSSRLDSNTRIRAAERRLKLMPRAKSANPRLVNRPTTISADYPIRSKSPNIVRTSSRPLTSPAARSTSSLTLQIPSRSTKSASCLSQRRRMTSRALSSDDDDVSVFNPVPSSLRRERKQSIYVDSTDLNTENDLPTFGRSNSRLSNSLTLPRTNSIGSKSNISIDRNIRKVRSTSTASSNVEIRIELVDDNDLGKDKNSQSDIKVNSNDNNHPTIEISKSNGADNSELLDVNTNDSTQPSNTTTTENSSAENNKPVNEASNATTDSIEIQIPITNGFTNAETLVVPDLTSPGDVTSQTVKPTTLAATETTDFTGSKTNVLTKVSPYQRAQETRKKSIMNIRKASALLAEGKTRTPFNCHEVEDNNKKEKPFRSIREGALACTDIDREVLDSSMGDDLYKEIKKGMLMGEVATSLYLEDKIDHFLDKVDGYVKENPNYVFDPDVTKAELLQKAREAKAAKPKKRNRLRRRQLERRLAEADINEMKKSRWLRHDDDELDNTGVNTLVIDQMKMLSKLKFSYDSD